MTSAHGSAASRPSCLSSPRLLGLPSSPPTPTMGDLPNPVPAKPVGKLPEKPLKQASKPPQSSSIPAKMTDTKPATPTSVIASSSSSSPASKKRKVAKTQTSTTPGRTGLPQEEPPVKAGPGPRGLSQNKGTASGSAHYGTGGPQRGGEKQPQPQRDPDIQHSNPVAQHSVGAGGEVQRAGGASGGQSNGETTGSGTISSRLPTDDPPVIRVSKSVGRACSRLRETDDFIKRSGRLPGRGHPSALRAVRRNVSADRWGAVLSAFRRTDRSRRRCVPPLPPLWS